jgi:hypothetical protein
MKRRLKKMKKTISGVLLALTAVFTLVACGKKKTTATTKKGTTKAATTKKGTTGTGTTAAGTTAAGTTAKKTTKANTSKQKVVATNKIRFYCWNNEFQTRVNDYYDQVNYVSGDTTYLLDGSYIEWQSTPSADGAYQSALWDGLANNLVDMFVFEADYVTAVNKNAKTADVSQIEGLNMDGQYKYTKDIVTYNGEIKGTSWQATPGVTVYNKNVAEAVWKGVTEKQMEDKLSDEAEFYAACEDVKAAKKFMMIGPDCWFRVFSNNLKEKMYDAENETLTIDESLFQWAKETKEFFTKRYIKSVDDDYGLWQGEWGAEMGKDNCLCIFSCPWFNDFCLKGYRHDATDDPDTMAIAEMKDAKVRIAPSHKGWFWGGTWLTATTNGLADTKIKASIEQLIKTMTTDTDTLVNIAKGAGDFTNDEAAMEELAESDFALDYFGGQNPYKYFVDSVAGADLGKASDFDQQVAENIQSAFRQYFQGTLDAEEAWEELVEALADKTSVDEDNIFVADSVELDGEKIIIA